VHWRFLDRVIAFREWEAAESVKAISLEEYNLLAPHGRHGDFPESLVLECCVENVRWLVAASSDFGLTSVLIEVSGFRFERKTGVGDRLRIAANVVERCASNLRVECRVTHVAAPSSAHVDQAEAVVATGALLFETLPLEEGFEREDLIALWNEIHGAS
jgi:hypothetical protein